MATGSGNTTSGNTNTLGQRSAGAAWLLGSAIGWLLHRLIGLPDLVGSLVGITPEKRLRLKVVILRDSNDRPLATTSQAEAIVEAATTALHEAANVTLEPAIGNEEFVEQLADPSPAYVLDPKCNWGGFQHNFTEVGKWYRGNSKGYTSRGGVVMFIVEDVQGKSGCFTGLVDFGYIDPGAVRDPMGRPAEGARQLTLAHELGHGCDLLHRKDPTNLMTPGSDERTTKLTRWQRAVLRTSRHVRYR